MSPAGATLLLVRFLKRQRVHGEVRSWNDTFNAFFFNARGHGNDFLITSKNNRNEKKITLKMWGSINTYTNAEFLTHTHRYCLNVIATVSHQTGGGGSASRWLPQGWQAGDSAHNEAAARDQLQDAAAEKKILSFSWCVASKICPFSKNSFFFSWINRVYDWRQVFTLLSSGSFTCCLTLSWVF